MRLTNNIALEVSSESRSFSKLIRVNKIESELARELLELNIAWANQTSGFYRSWQYLKNATPKIPDNVAVLVAPLYYVMNSFIVVDNNIIVGGSSDDTTIPDQKFQDILDNLG